MLLSVNFKCEKRKRSRSTELVVMSHEASDLSVPDLLMRDLLLQRKFSFDKPDVRTAWQAFKIFANLPIPGLPPYSVGYQCFHDEGRDDVLWLYFARRTLDVRDTGCEFSCQVPTILRGTNESDWWWPECETFGEWIERVEQKYGFGTCMNLTNWQWEGFAD
jgi:hypothetical protein